MHGLSPKGNIDLCYILVPAHPLCIIPSSLFQLYSICKHHVFPNATKCKIKLITASGSTNQRKLFVCYQNNDINAIMRVYQTPFPCTPFPIFPEPAIDCKDGDFDVELAPEPESELVSGPDRPLMMRLPIPLSISVVNGATTTVAVPYTI